MPEVKDPNILAQLNGQQAPVQQASPPPFIPGTPKPVDPMEAERLRIQQEAAARAARGEVRDIAKDERQAQKDAMGSVEQTKAANFLARGLQANQDYSSLGDIGPRSIVGEVAAENFPRITNTLSDADRQKADQAERAFIAAILRYDSGAAIPPEEFVTSGKIYFPRAGDTPEVIKQKAEARRTALEGLLAASGPAGEKYRDALAPQPQVPAEGGAGENKKWTMQDTISFWGGEAYDENGNPLGPTGGGAYDAQGNYLGLYGSGQGTQSAYDQQVQSEADRLNQTMGEVNLNQLAQQGAMFGLGDEATGVGTAIGRLLTGDTNIAGNYELGRDAERLRLEQARQRYGGVGTAAEVIGGVGSGGNIMSGSALRGATTGGAMGGFGYGEGTEGSVGGAVIGAGLGAGTYAGMNALAPRIQRALTPRQATTAQADLINSAQRLENSGMPVPLRQADIRPELAPQRAQARASDRGRAIVTDAEQADIQAFEEALNKVGGNRATGRESVGDATQSALAANRRATGERGGALYARARDMAGNVEITPNSALSQIDRQIAELKQNGERSNRALISYLEDLRSDFSRGGPVNTGILDAQGRPITRPPEGLSIDSLRAQRTNMRGQISERNLTMTDAERRVGIVLDAAAEDVRAALAGNPEALNAFRTADDYWRTRAQFIKQIERQIVGPDASNPISAEAAASKLESWARRDYKRLTRLMNELPPENRADIRAYFADSLGRDGQGNFSLNLFLSNTGTGSRAKASPQAMRLIFGEDGMRAINDLRSLAQAKVNASSATNYSNTGGVVNKALGGLRTAIFGALGYMVGDGAGAAGGMMLAPVAAKVTKDLGERRMARLVTNPDFTKWLKNMPEATEPKAINKYFEVLTKTASRSPVFAADVKALQQVLMDAFQQSPSKLAAEGQQENNGR